MNTSFNVKHFYGVHKVIHFSDWSYQNMISIVINRTERKKLTDYSKIDITPYMSLSHGFD